jgi:hypothetical protein
VGRLNNGDRFQRTISYGGSRAEPGRNLSNDWGRRPAELHVSDLPIDELIDLQVSIDLIGPGRVWVDDIEVVQTWLHPEERNYLRGQLLVAKQKLANGNSITADRVLRTSWSEYLFDLASQPNIQRRANPFSQQSDARSDWKRPKQPLQQFREGMRPRWGR